MPPAIPKTDAVEPVTIAAANLHPSAIGLGTPHFDDLDRLGIARQPVATKPKQRATPTPGLSDKCGVRALTMTPHAKARPQRLKRLLRAVQQLQQTGKVAHTTIVSAKLEPAERRLRVNQATARLSRLALSSNLAPAAPLAAFEFCDCVDCACALGSWGW